MSSPNLIPVISQDGSQRGQVDAGEFSAAQADGWRRAVPVANDQGQKGLVAVDEFPAAQKSGWKISDDGGIGMWQAFKNTMPGWSDLIHGAGLPANPQEAQQMGQAEVNKSAGQKITDALTGSLGPAPGIISSMAKEGYRGVKGMFSSDPMEQVNAPMHLLSGANPFSAPVTDAMTQQGLGTPQANAIGIPAAGALTAGLVGSRVAGAIPSKARAGALFNEASSIAGDTPIDMTAPGNTAFQIRDMAQSGGRMPKVIRDFISRGTDPSQGPMTFDEARQFYQNAGSLSANERNGLTPNMQRMVTQFRNDLGDSIQGAATQAGAGQQYGQAMNQYRQFKTLQDFKDFLKQGSADYASTAIKGAGYGAGGYAAYKLLDLIRGKQR